MQRAFLVFRAQTSPNWGQGHFDSLAFTVGVIGMVIGLGKYNCGREWRVGAVFEDRAEVEDHFELLYLVKCFDICKIL